MQRLNPDKLYVKYLAGASPEQLTLPRRYTLTHSDRTGDLFLSIGSEYNTKDTSKLYTRLMRDEVLAVLSEEGGNLVFRVCCHVSGGFVLGTARLRYRIFQSELSLALEAIRYGDRALFEKNPKLGKTPIITRFQSTDSRFDKIEKWGVIADYQ
jgi:hypothetical protein